MKTSHEKIEIWAYKTDEKSVFISPKTKQAHVTRKIWIWDEEKLPGRCGAGQAPQRG